MKKINKVKIIVFAGLLVSMNIVLSRVLSIPVGPTIRITVSQTPVYLAGFWFWALLWEVSADFWEI